MEFYYIILKNRRRVGRQLFMHCPDILCSPECLLLFLERHPERGCGKAVRGRRIPQRDAALGEEPTLTHSIWPGNFLQTKSIIETYIRNG